MKKKILISVLATLCLFLSAAGQIRPLKVGDTVPDVKFNIFLNGKLVPTSLSAYRGKLLILDFWATWCSPCVAMIPKMEVLQKQFNGKVQFISVSNQATSRVSALLDHMSKRDKQQYTITQVTQDTTLGQYFPHFFLPHYVWIDPHGKVRATTEFQDVNAATIEAYLDDREAKVRQKIDAPALAYNDSVPLLINGNGGNGSDLIYHSILTGYKPGLPLQRLFTNEPNGGLRMMLKNLNPLQLIAVSYMDKCRDYLLDLDSIKLKVKDTSKLTSNAIGMEYDQWLANGHGYCYEIKVPANMKKQLFAIMREEITRMFPDFTPSLITKDVPCLNLTSIGSHERLASKGGEGKSTITEEVCGIKNRPIRFFVAAINANHLTKIPVVNRTGITDNIDLQVKSNFNDLDAVNRELKFYGLRLERGTQQDNILLISDHLPDTPK